MTTINASNWNGQDDLENKPAYQYESNTTLNSVSNSAVDPDDDDKDLDDEDFDDDDLDYDDEDFDDDDLDDEDFDDEDEDGYERVAGTPATSASGIDKSYDTDGNEIPEQEEADHESPGYTTGTEVEQQDRGDEASFSERNDVTPPTPHEFPSTGTHTETDFASRPLGRSTGRMLGHEPGTEGGPL